MRGWAWLAAAFALLAAPALSAETLTLTGVMTGTDHATYREVPFAVPAGTTSITVEFAYTGREQRAVIDLGLRDPERFRGWSGGNKASFTVAETWATASYLPGPLPAGEWKLILGVPNIGEDVRAAYTAKITLGRNHTFNGFAAAPLKAGPGWYRGDLHLHTGHSDGSCASRTGKRVPCPLHKTLEAAAARGLDFAAVTEHNATSHHQHLAELQPYFDDLLLIPGREITTFQGHANVFGTTAPLDFQLGGPRAPGLDHIQDQVEASGGVFSINHPGLPTGPLCMGCGWSAKTDYRRVAAVEVVSGARAEGPLSGMAFWEARLNAGFRITGVGGSDNHDPAPGSIQPPVGAPTTVVRAENLSQAAILAGIKAGHVFIDLEGVPGRRLDVTARADGRSAGMGDTLVLPQGVDAEVEIAVDGAAGGRIEFRSDPGLLTLPPIPVSRDAARVNVAVAGDGRAHWLRVDVRGADGKLRLIGNPIYFEGR
ncbi:MAG: CehA/McbA family metallohydrolase [Pseudomonadota bacterium]